MRPYVPYGPPRFQHQIAGLRKLIATRGLCALLFDPGTGKTCTALDYLTVLALAQQSEIRVLVIAPLAAIDTWIHQSGMYVHPDVAVWAEALGGGITQKAEQIAARNGVLGKTAQTPSYGVERAVAFYCRGRDGSELHDPATAPEQGPEAHGPGPRITLLATNLDVFSSRQAISKTRTKADMVEDAVRRFAPDVVIVDESHRIKSPTSNVSRSIARLAAFVPRRILLTGTVMPHSPLDVWAQWRFMQPLAFGTTTREGIRKPASFGAFKQRYCRFGGWMGKEVVGYCRLDEMQDAMAANSIVARKADVLDLPPVTDVIIDVNLDRNESKAYADMRDQLAVSITSGDLADATASNMLARGMRLRQITCGYLPDDGGETHEIGTTKAKVIQSLVRDTLAGENRIVIFANFVHEIDQLKRLLTVSDTVVEVIHGGVPTGDRVKIRRRFGDPEQHPERIVLIAQVRTMSLAVNELVAASHAIFASLSRQRDDYEQARARLDRQGQTKPVTLWHAIAPNTVDEVILDAHRQRTSLEAAMLRHIIGTHAAAGAA